MQRGGVLPATSKWLHVHWRSVSGAWEVATRVAHLGNTHIMSGGRGEEFLSHARELERRDAEASAGIEAVTSLLGRADAIRAGAVRVRDALARIPAELVAVDEAAREAAEREAAAALELVEAERRLGDAGRSKRAGAGANANAERAVRRAQDALSDAAARVERIDQRRRSLLDDEVALRAEADGLAVAARDAAVEIHDLPRVSDSGRAMPGSGLDKIEQWGARAHAALFVVRGGLETERERLVTEASLLGTTVLGEQLAGSSVALVRKRLEAFLLE